MSNLIEQIADEVGVQIKLASTKDFLSSQEVTASICIYLWIISFLFKSHKEMIGNTAIAQSNSPHVTMKNYGTQQRRKKRN